MHVLSLTEYRTRCFVGVGVLGCTRGSQKSSHSDWCVYRYCNLQLENEKTAAVLKRSFRYLGDASDLFVARYMTEVLFNHDFHYDVDPQTKQELKDNRKDLGVSMGISKDKRDQIQDKVLDGLRAGFMEAEEAGLDGLGLSDDEEDESKGEPDSGAGSNKESS